MGQATDTAFAMDVWHASQKGVVQGYARKLWYGDEDGAQDGIQEAILTALARGWDDPTKGTLTTLLGMILKTVWQTQRSRGYRKGSSAAPRLTFPGEERIPVSADLCDPEAILIAREIDLGAVSKRVADRYRNTPKLTHDDVRAIRASDLKNYQLAERFNVDRATISNVRRGKTYREVV